MLVFPFTPSPERPAVMLRRRNARAALLCGCLCSCLLGVSVPSHAAALDFLFGKRPGDNAAAPLDPKQRQWRLGEFTAIQLAPREANAAANQHPAVWSAFALRQPLAAVHAELRGVAQPLFAGDELEALVGPLSQALSLAGPDDDVLLLSTHRRGSGILIAPLGITARLFVQDGRLQMIVHDARLDFVDAYIGTKLPPTFTYGSRAKAGNAVLQGAAAAAGRRADWVSMLPTAAVAAPAQAVPATSLAPAVPPAPPTAKPRDPGFADEIEQRLLTLKRLLDRGLITETEYQQKRAEVLKLL
jgi:Short C-terminal domain